jgi:hypothetical protein
LEILKEEIVNAISSLPETAEIDEIMYRLYVIDKIKKGQNAVRENKIISIDALKTEMKSW